MELPRTTLNVIAGARWQSPDELLEFIVETPGCSTGVDFEPRPPLPWADVMATIRELPTIDQIRGHLSPLRARVVTLIGMVLYAYTYGLLDDFHTIRGILCFPNEAEDLERQQQFIIEKTAEGAASLFTLDECPVWGVDGHLPTGRSRGIREQRQRRAR